MIPRSSSTAAIGRKPSRGMRRVLEMTVVGGIKTSIPMHLKIRRQRLIAGKSARILNASPRARLRGVGWPDSHRSPVTSFNSINAILDDDAAVTRAAI
jgi:hypothetical protein